MPDTKLTGLTADASPTSDDLVYVVNDPGGTPASKKVTLANIATLIGSLLGISGSNTGDQTITLTGDVTGSGTGSFAATIGNDKVTFAKMQNVATDSLIGRDTAGTGDPENILLNATLSMDGAGNLQRAALTGDVTASAGSNSTSIANSAVTYAKIQNVTDARLLGNNTGGAAAPSEITVGNGLEFNGSAIRRSALTGDVTASAGSNATTIANDAVTYAKLQNVAGMSVVGRSTNSSGDAADITATANQVLVCNSGGTSVAFGAVNLASSSAVTGQLAHVNIADYLALRTSELYTSLYDAGTSGTQSASANTIYLYPFLSLAKTTVTKLYCHISVGGGSGKLGRLGVWRMGAGGSQGGQPDTLVVDSGTFDANATGLVTASVSFTVDPYEIFWIGFVTDGTPTMISAATYTKLPGILGVTALSGVNTTGSYTASFTFGALGNTPTCTRQTGGNIVRMAYGV